MKNRIVAIVCFMGLIAGAQNREIEFKEGDWKMQLERAKKENKLIFFDAYAIWCGPCKMMAKNVFTKDSVADLFNQKFINVKFDMEKGEGITLKEKYEVIAYPTYLFINAEGKLIHKIVGSMTAKEFMQEADNALNPANTLFGLQKNFEASPKSGASALAYLEGLDKAYEAGKKATVSKIYFDGLSKPLLLQEHQWKLAVKYLNNPSSEAFAYLFANKIKLETQFGVEEVNKYFKSTFTSSVSLIKGAYTKNSGIKEAKEMSIAIQKLLSQENEYSKPLLAKLDIINFVANNQWDELVNKVNTVYEDKNFSKKIIEKHNFIIIAANEILTASQKKQYENLLKWADWIENDNPSLTTMIQVTELRKRVLKRQGKIAESEIMAVKEKNLIQEAVDKKQPLPKMQKD
jgi:thiol-disulfide isomerase/thioredoxin